MTFKFWFSGNPIPKGRPRYDGHHYYTPEATRDWEESVAFQAGRQFRREPLKGDLGIEFVFFREDKRRVDIDNLEKAMLDGMSGVFFEDDSQVKVKKATLRYDEERPGVEVTIWEL